MKFRYKIAALICLSLLLTTFPTQVWAQTGSPGEGTPSGSPTITPTDLPTGEITGKIVNQNDPSKPVGDLEVMLHVLDADMNQLGMLHGKSLQDGSFKIADVPFRAGMNYAAAVVYDGTTYYSPVVPAEADKTTVKSLNVPVYESTTDLSKVRVEQMHVLFSFAQDGMEVKEVYVLSNLGDRTVKGGLEVPGNKEVKAAVRFPLPEKADFINFEPQSEGRFLKYPGGFADTAPLVPGQMVSQIVAGYLLPYTTPLTYQLKTTLAVQGVNFVVSKESGVTLKGTGLGEPEPVTAQDGQLYYLYKLENIPAGQTLDLSFEGKPNIPKSQVVEASITTKLPNQLPLFLGLGILGVVLIGGGAFWWVRSSKQSNGNDFEDKDLEGEGDEGDQAGLDALLVQIAQLDTAFEQGEVNEDTYYALRNDLKTQAKALLAEREEETAQGDPVSSQ